MKKVVETSQAPAAIGPYSQAIFDEVSGFLFCSGQIGLVPATGAVRRKSSFSFADSAGKPLISQRNWSRRGQGVRPVTHSFVVSPPQAVRAESYRYIWPA